MCNVRKIDTAQIVNIYANVSMVVLAIRKLASASVRPDIPAKAWVFRHVSTSACVPSYCYLNFSIRSSVRSRVAPVHSVKIVRKIVLAWDKISTARLSMEFVRVYQAGRVFIVTKDYAPTACTVKIAKTPVSALRIILSGNNQILLSFNSVNKTNFIIDEFICLLENFSCHPWTGKCKCKAGWTGPTCSRPCPYFMYGEDCAFTCNCNRSGNTLQCLPNNGTCVCNAGLLFFFYVTSIKLGALVVIVVFVLL